MSPLDPELDDLLAACFTGPADVDTLTRFYDAFRPLVMAILISLTARGTRLNEDAYQTAFIKFMVIFREGRDHRIDYVPYFVAIAKHCLIDELRRRRGQVPLDELLEEDFAGIGPDEDRRREARLILLQAIPKLSHRCQVVLERYYVTGTGIAELANLLKIEEKSVYVVLQRCRENLKNLIAGR